MDVSNKIATDAQNAFNELPSERNNGNSSSNNNSLDPSFRASRSDNLQDSLKSSKTTVTKGTVNTKITEAAFTMLNVSQNENHKSSTSTMNIRNEEESRVEISGRTIS